MFMFCIEHAEDSYVGLDNSERETCYFGMDD